MRRMFGHEKINKILRKLNGLFGEKKNCFNHLENCDQNWNWHCFFAFEFMKKNQMN